MKHKLFIKMPYLKMIKNGSKPLEARANYPNLRNIKENDIIIFMSGSIELHTITKRITSYKTVDEMLNNEIVDHLVPGMSFKEARNVYNSIYPPEKVKKNNGMIVFELKVLQ